MQVISYLHTKKYITYSPRGEGFQTIKCKINVLLTNTIYRLQFEFNNLSRIACRFEVRESILLATFIQVTTETDSFFIITYYRKNKRVCSVCLHLHWLLLFPSFPRNSSPTNEIHTGTNIPNTDSDQFHGKLLTDKHNALKLIP